MLKKGNWQQREPVTDETRSTGKLDKKRDHELKRGPIGRRSSNARQLGCVFQDKKPPKSTMPAKMITDTDRILSSLSHSLHFSASLSVLSSLSFCLSPSVSVCCCGGGCCGALLCVWCCGVCVCGAMCGV